MRVNESTAVHNRCPLGRHQRYPEAAGSAPGCSACCRQANWATVKEAVQMRMWYFEYKWNDNAWKEITAFGHTLLDAQLEASRRIHRINESKVMYTLRIRRHYG
jgi:hypothetical protein